MATAAGPLLQAEHVVKYFPIKRGILFQREVARVHAVDDVSLEVQQGETLGLVGESGCGKSTLGRAFVRLFPLTDGRIVFDGQDISTLSRRGMRPMRRELQIIFQDPYASLNPRQRVGQIVGTPLAIHGIGDRRERKRQVQELLQKVGLSPEHYNRFPHEFSGGQRQRIGIARALAVRPDFIVCDEPVSALDVSVQAQVMNLLEQIQDELGVSFLFISHDLRAVQYTSHRVAVMYLGKIVEIGPTADVAEKRLHPYTRALFSAIPSLEPGGKRRLMLAGEPPSALAVPRGCGFFSRCPKADKGKCDVEVPPLSEIAPGEHHRVACFYPEAAGGILQPELKGQ